MKKSLFMLALIFLYLPLYLAAAEVENPLLVHQAKSMELAKSTDPDGVYPYILTLHDVSPYVIYFSDRPERFSGIMKIEEYLEVWGDKEANLIQNPPNVGISYDSFESTTSQNMRTDVLVLNRPVYNNENQSVTYLARPLHQFEVRIGKYKNTILYLEINQNLNIAASQTTL